MAGWMRQWTAVVGVSAAGFDILLAVSCGPAPGIERGASVARHDSADEGLPLSIHPAYAQ